METPTELDAFARGSQTQSLYNSLMAINAQAFGARLYNVSYHALAAALHCARELPNDEAIAEVGRKARQQLGEIDRQAPDYEHSTRSAAARGHNNIFDLLSRQAATLVDERRIQRRLQSGRPEV